MQFLAVLRELSGYTIWPRDLKNGPINVFGLSYCGLVVVEFIKVVS